MGHVWRPILSIFSTIVYGIIQVPHAEPFRQELFIIVFQHSSLLSKIQVYRGSGIFVNLLSLGRGLEPNRPWYGGEERHSRQVKDICYVEELV